MKDERNEQLVEACLLSNPPSPFHQPIRTLGSSQHSIGVPRTTLRPSRLHLGSVRNECPVYAFFFVFPLFRSLNHIPLSRPVTSLFILIFHPLLHACTCDIQPARRVSFFSLFSNHVIDHLITMCLPHGFVVTDPIAPSQSVLLLVSMFVLCWKPNMACALCAFSIYSLSPP